MRRKLRRSRSVFSKRRVPRGLKVLGALVLCVAVMAGGFFTAKWVTERNQGTADNEVLQPLTPPTSGKQNSNTDKPSTDGEDVVTPGDDTPQTPATLSTIRGFYLPYTALRSDTLSSTLSAAYAAGFNAVLFDLKDADGNLGYQFTSAQAKKVNSYAADALTADELTAAFDQIREHGLLPIPRLYAFQDDLACAKLTDARIAHVDNHTWAWYDGNKADGAKKWLNPYSDAAQSYVRDLATELKGKGAAAVMLDGVQFPDKLDKSAYLGDLAATVGKDQVLTDFVAATRIALGADCPLLLACSEKGALATDTKVYGGNPLTFGATVASPLLSSKWQDSVEKMVLRTQVLEQKTALAPLLKTDGLTAAKVNDAISGVVAGGTDSFILYSADGVYDFAAYTLP